MTTTFESQIYRDLMRFRPEGLSLNAWAVKAGVSRTVWVDVRRHGNPSRRTLEKLLAAADSSLAEFEALRLGDMPTASTALRDRLGDGRHAWMGAPPPSLPLIPSVLAGEWGASGNRIELMEIRPGELLERLTRPSSLASDPDAFALTMVGESMWPRFRPGNRIAVSPRAPVAIGDDVLVRLRRDPAVRDEVEQVVIAQLVKRAASSLELRQFNPNVTIRIEADDVDAIFKIPGELI